jgi:uncharacterized protein (TIGR02646 family)
MRYIQKLNKPYFFINDTKNLRLWSDYYSTKKRVLKEYILKEEQNYLCCYCEDKIDVNNSHIEHVKPKHLDIDNLTFDYYNLAVSCEGQCRNSEEDNTRYNCGHRKDKEDTQYDENKFLSPLKVEDIREYFVYDSDAKISPSDKERNKAEYMINTLHLNDGGLPRARKDALKDFEELDIEIDEFIFLLKSEDLAFISFLRYKYQHLI